MDHIGFQFNDGGRAAAGHQGRTGDCGVRAIAIAVFGADGLNCPITGQRSPYRNFPDYLDPRYQTRAALAYERAASLVTRHAARERKKKHKSAEASRSSLTTGIYHRTMRRIMADPEVAALGWRWRPTVAVGGGCTTHLRADELPSGRLLVTVSRHFTTVIDGVIYDRYDPSREGTRCVYGFWYQEGST